MSSRMQFLSKRDVKIISSLSHAFLDPECLEIVSPAEVAAKVDAYLSRIDSRRLWRVKFLFKIMDWLAVPWRIRRLGDLSPSTSRKLIQRWYAGRLDVIKLMLKGVRSMILLCYYNDTRTFSFTSYVPFEERKKIMGDTTGRLGGTAVGPELQAAGS